MNQIRAVEQDHAVVLFDGVCNLCHGAVRFIVERDPNGYFHYASLQGKTAQELLGRHGLPVTLDSLLLVEQGQIYQQSDAALRICSRLPGAWRMLAWFRIIPRPIRDLIYRFIATNRYRWFGQAEQCLLPSPHLQSRFYE